jgi:hypothetical protein
MSFTTVCQLHLTILDLLTYDLLAWAINFTASLEDYDGLIRSTCNLIDFASQSGKPAGTSLSYISSIAVYRMFILFYSSVHERSNCVFRLRVSPGNCRP